VKVRAWWNKHNFSWWETHSCRCFHFVSDLATIHQNRNTCTHLFKSRV